MLNMNKQFVFVCHISKQCLISCILLCGANAVKMTFEIRMTAKVDGGDLTVTLKHFFTRKNVSSSLPSFGERVENSGNFK